MHAIIFLFPRAFQIYLYAHSQQYINILINIRIKIHGKHQQMSQIIVCEQSMFQTLNRYKKKPFTMSNIIFRLTTRANRFHTHMRKNTHSPLDNIFPICRLYIQ